MLIELKVSLLVGMVFLCSYHNTFVSKKLRRQFRSKQLSVLIYL